MTTIGLVSVGAGTGSRSKLKAQWPKYILSLHHGMTEPLSVSSHKLRSCKGEAKKEMTESYECPTKLATGKLEPRKEARSKKYEHKFRHY